MSDLLHHDVADDAFHEIQLSGKQLVFLFMATTIVAVVIFLCGVQVGRGMKVQPTVEAADPAAVAAVPSNHPAPATASAAEPAPTEPPPPAKETAEDLSYAKRLQSDVPPNDKVKARTDAPAPVPAKTDAAKIEPAPARPEPAPVAKADAAPKVDPPSRGAGKTAGTKGTQVPQPAGGRPGVWVVQVHALKDHGQAAALAQRLTGKGYPAFVLSPAAGAPAIYRVQVGRFNDRHEAEQVARRLEREEQFKPWI